MATNYEEWMQKMVDSIEETLKDDCNLDNIIKDSCYSKTHFYRIFGAIIGLSPSEYRNKRRLSCAAVDICLLNKRRLIDIAVEYGFASQEVFTRAFEREFGITPGVLRKESISLPLYQKAEIGERIKEKRNLLQEYDAKLIVKQACNLIGFESVVTPGSSQIRNLWAQIIEHEECMELNDADLVYGICEFAPDITDEDEFSYFFGREGTWKKGKTGIQKRISASKYVRILHEPQKRSLKETYQLFYGCWLPISELELEPKATMELYHLKDDKLEILIPVK